MALYPLRVTSVSQGTSLKTSLFFCFALLFKELLFKDEAKLKAGCNADCDLFLFPFLSLPFFFPWHLFPFNIRCQAYTGRNSQLILPEQQCYTGSGLSCRIPFFFLIIHIYVWEGNRDYWKEFQQASASVGSSAMWKADWDCRPSFIAIIQSQVGHNQHGMDFSQSSLFSSGPMGIDDIFWKFWNLFPFPVSMVSLLNLVHSFSSFSWNHRTFAELQICAPTAERMDLYLWYMPISKSQDKKHLHVVSWLPLRAGTSCQRSDCKSAFWRCWP